MTATHSLPDAAVYISRYDEFMIKSPFLADFVFTKVKSQANNGDLLLFLFCMMLELYFFHINSLLTFPNDSLIKSEAQFQINRSDCLPVTTGGGMSARNSSCTVQYIIHFDIICRRNRRIK